MEKTTRRRSLLSVLLVLTFLLAPLSALRVRADQGVTATASTGATGDWKTYNVVLNNGSDKNLSDWTMTFEIPEGSTWQGSWNFKETVSGRKVTLKMSASSWQLPVPGESKGVGGFNIQGAPDGWKPSISVSPSFADPTPVPATPTDPDAGED